MSNTPKIINSQLLYRWLKDLFKLGLSRPIEEGDIYKTLKAHESKKLSENFAALWVEEQKNEKPSLFRVMRKMYAKKILGIGIFFSFVDSLSRWLNCLKIYTVNICLLFMFVINEQSNSTAMLRWSSNILYTIRIGTYQQK